MKTILISLFTLLLISTWPSCAQAPDTLWTRTYGGWDSDEAYSVAVTPDGGCALAGYTYSFGAGDADFYLIKVDSVGNLQWQRTYGGSEWDMAYAMKCLPGGGYILCGVTESFGNGTPVYTNGYVVRIDDAGDTLWTRTYGGIDNEQFNGLTTTPDGGFVFIGSTESFGSGGDDFYIVCTDSSGNELWNAVLGGHYTEIARAVAQTNDGGFLVVGRGDSFAAGRGNIYLAQLTSAGDTVWTRNISNGAIEVYESARSINIVSSGDAFLCGSFTQTPSEPDKAYVVRINANGDTLWTHPFGDILYSSRSRNARLTPDGGIVLTGITGDPSPFSHYENTIAARLSGDGTVLWDTIYGQPLADWGNDIEVLSDGGYLIAGAYATSLQYISDIYLVRTQPDPVSTSHWMPVQLPNNLSLRVYPNPFNSSAQISFMLPVTSRVTLRMYDVLGCEVKSLMDEMQTAGEHRVSFDGSDLSSGVYLCRMRAGAFQQTRKIVLIR